MAFTFLYLLAVISSPIVIYALYKLLRPKFPIRVNCWFCGEDSVVPYGNRNCWDCPKCSQYNGFSEDGDYNKPIPPQYEDELNYPVSCKPQDFISTSGLLCEECNRNQLLKIKQLAAFEPLNETNYNTEVEHYEKQLEETYRLCPYCSFKVSDELNKQNEVLKSKTSYKEMKEGIMNNSVSSEKSFNDSSILITNEEKRQLWIQIPASILLVLCCITLFFSSVYKMLEHDVMACEHYFPDDVIDRIEGLQNYATTAMYGGIVACFLVKLSYGKGKLFVIDAVHIYMLFMLVIVCHLPINKWLTDSDDAIINILLTSAIAILTFYSFSVSRTKKPKHSFKRYSLNNSTNSVNSSPLSSVSTSKKAVQSNNCDSQQYDAVNQHNDNLDLFFDSFSIGSSLSRKKYDSGIFGSNNSLYSNATQNTGRLDIQQRPLISPAKFRIQKPISPCDFRPGSFKNSAFTTSSSVASYKDFVNPFLGKSFQRCSSSASLNSTSQSNEPTNPFNQTLNKEPLFQTFNTKQKFGYDVSFGQPDFFNASTNENTLLHSPPVSDFSVYRNSHLRYRDVTSDRSEDREPSSTSDFLTDSHTEKPAKAESKSIWNMPFVVGFLMGASIVCNGLLIFAFMRS